MNLMASLRRLALHRWIPTVVLIVLAAGSATVLRQLETDEATSGGDAGHTPDFFMDNFESTVHGLDGQPVRIVRAKQLLHFPDTQTRELESPYLTLYNSVRTPWHILADQSEEPKDVSGDALSHQVVQRSPSAECRLSAAALTME